MNELVPHQACPTCGCSEYRVVATVEQLENEKQFRDRLFRREWPDVPNSMLNDLTVFTNSYPARLVECRDCGLVCRDPRFSPQASIQAYASDDYSDIWLESTFSEYYDSYARRMPELKRVVGEQALILEVGSYVGGFLAAARDNGWVAQGVDVGQKVSEFSRAKTLNVFTGTLFDARLASATFDAVFVWVCFDQLSEPLQVLNEIHRILRPSGWLFLQIPNGDFIKSMEPLARGPMRAPVKKALAYTGMAGFPYQLGYTPAVLFNLLPRNGFRNVTVTHQMDVCDGTASATRQPSEQVRYVRQIGRMSAVLARVSGGRLVKSPWLLVTCQK